MSKIKSKTWRGDGLRYAHLKLDGLFVRVKSKLLDLRVETSLPSDITRKVLAVPRLGMIVTRVPLSHVVLGELHVESGARTDVKTALNKCDPRLTMTLFAVETICEEAPLEEIQDWCECYGLPFAPFLTQPWPDDAQVWPPCFEPGSEGWMMKDGNLLNWQKLKRERTIDLIVDSVTEGCGKYLGLIGALVLKTAEGHIVANCSGMSDATRIDISLHEDEWIGVVVEVKYQHVGSRGRLQHPRFLRRRDDKFSDECTRDQDPDLEAIWSS